MKRYQVSADDALKNFTDNTDARDGYNVRSLYSGSSLYVVTGDTIYTYDLKNDCALIAQTTY